MKDFSTVLLIHILRATIQTIEESPGIDSNHAGIRQFEGTLLGEIARLVEQSPPARIAPAV